MYNLEFVPENEKYKVLWDYELQRGPLNSAKQQDLVITNEKKKRTSRIVDFAVPADSCVKLKESEMRDNYPDLAKEVRLGNMKVIPSVIDTLGTVPKKTGRYEIQRINRVHPD